MAKKRFKSDSKKYLLLSLVCLIVAFAGLVTVFNSKAAITCDLNATTSNFASQVSTATAGQTICLATGNYGTWSGINKAITIQAASGASPQMNVSFGLGDSGFTLDGMTNMGGNIGSGASNITIRNSTFTSPLDISGARGILIDNNKFDWNSQGTCCKIPVGDITGTIDSPAVTISNNHIANGESDGIQIQGTTSGLLILNNTFDNLCDIGANHTDNIQMYATVTETKIAGNYIHASSSCPTQGITSFDSGTNGVIIENNVVDIHRPWAIELYADKNSKVIHNTVVYHPDSDCDFTGQPCGQIDINRKTADPAGSGTQVYDNIVTDVGFNSGSTGTAHHNVSGQTAIYVGGTTPTTHDGFLLASNSPVGRNAATDGTNAGIYSNGSNGGGTTTCSVKQGDANNDNAVNILDISVILSAYGQTGTTSCTDVTKDGSVNIQDISLVLSKYGS